MPAYFHIDLDTTAPDLQWGLVRGAARGGFLRVAYTVNEPGVVAAQFIDAANRVTDLTVEPDRLIGLLPRNTAYGQGVVRAWLQDEVGNTSVRSLNVQIRRASFHLRLDTTPPIITWGPVDGTDATEEFVVLYAINEPQLLNAELQLADNRRLPLQVQSDRLTVVLPADTPEGLATVHAYVRDDVGNEADRTLVVYLSGVLPTPVIPRTAGGMPQLPSVVPPRIVTSAVSVTTVSEHARAEADVFMLSEVEIRTEFRQAARLRGTSRGLVSSRAAVAGTTVASRSSVRIASAHYGTSKVLEGPRAEEELLILLELV